jgi:hypothetical protein
MVSVTVSQRLDRKLSWPEYRVEFHPSARTRQMEIQCWFLSVEKRKSISLTHFAFEDEGRSWCKKWRFLFSQTSTALLLESLPTARPLIKQRQAKWYGLRGPFFLDGKIIDSNHTEAYKADSG